MKNQIKLINEAFARLSFLNNKNWTPYLDKLFEGCVEEERSHRGSGCSFAQHHPQAVSVQQAARMFAVKRVAEYLIGERMPRGRDYLHTQKSCFVAAGLVDEYRKEIRKAWRGLPVAELAALDYCRFVSPEKAA